MSDTLQKIRNFLQKSYEDTKRDIELHDDIRQLLVEKFQGKKITKRTLTYIQQKHPSWTVNYYGIANSVYIRVWGGDSGFKDHNDYGRVYLGQHDTHFDGFDVAKFDECNLSVVNARKEQEARFKLLMDADRLTTIAAAIDQFNAQRAALLEAVKSLPDRFSFEELFTDKK